MKYVWIVYVKSEKFEFVFAFLNQNDANICCKNWGKCGTVHQVQIG